MNRNRIFAIGILCVLMSTSSLFTSHADQYPGNGVSNDNYEEWLAIGERYREEQYSVRHYQEITEQGLTIDEYYENPSTHTMVIDFFVRLTGSEPIALPIIYHAEQNSVPLSLAFSVSWVESKYKPYASNNNPSTTDRGLFQLNSASFRNLVTEEFFNPEINSLHAARHLRYCLDKGANDIETALAIYNAGLGRVRSGSIPQSTQVYISRVVEYRQNLIRRFNAFVANQVERAQQS